jgi:hypothetical protein
LPQFHQKFQRLASGLQFDRNPEAVRLMLREMFISRLSIMESL